jgi:hypothetical protein
VVLGLGTGLVFGKELALGVATNMAGKEFLLILENLSKME